jgi:uncharacterized protein YjcR
MAKKLLDTNAAAEHYGCSPETLKSWRMRGVGPKHIKIIGLVRYHKRDLDEHVRANRRASTGAEPTVQNLETSNGKRRRS